MKNKIALPLILAIVSAVITSSPKANANYEVVMGPLGPEVRTNFNPPASFGPTVGGSNGGTIGGPGGSYAIVDSNGNVTNTVVCHSFCANGTFGPGGDTAVLQVPNSNAGIWFGPNTTTYDRETKTFTAIDPIAREITNNDGDTSTKIFGKKTLTFVSGNVFLDTNNTPQGVIQGWTEDSPATVKVTKAYIENELEKFKAESLTLAQRMTEGELSDVAKAENKTLIIENIVSVVRLLNTWIKSVMGKIN